MSIPAILIKRRFKLSLITDMRHVNPDFRNDAGLTKNNKSA
ncbi:MAG: hypothetical protein JWN76_2446 [Chitinophagaceae bacterium]|nr:hypothetical protein [Chitinophagaceae bacterium]